MGGKNKDRRKKGKEEGGEPEETKKNSQRLRSFRESNDNKNRKTLIEIDFYKFFFYCTASRFEVCWYREKEKAIFVCEKYIVFVTSKNVFAFMGNLRFY